MQKNKWSDKIGNMKCPFCGEELEQFQGCARCNTEDCVAGFDPIPNQIWQALIDGKKAQDALKVARNLYQELALAHCEMADDYRSTYGCLKTPEQETQEYMQEYDEKITSITTRNENEIS